MTSLKSNILLFVFKFQTGFPRPSDDVPQPPADVQTLSSKMCSRIWTRTTSWYCSGVSLKQQKETFHWSIFLNWVQEAKYFNTANSVLRVHWLAVVVLNVKFMFWQWLVYWFLLQFILRFFTLLLHSNRRKGGRRNDYYFCDLHVCSEPLAEGFVFSWGWEHGILQYSVVNHAVSLVLEMIFQSLNLLVCSFISCYHLHVSLLRLPATVR